MSARSTDVRNEPNSAVAASTAVAIAMPLVMALVVLPTASSSVSGRAPSSARAPDISAMPCVVADRPEGVHRDDDAGGGEQAAAGQRDRVEGRAGADQEGDVDGAADEQRGVDGRLQAEGDAGENDGRRTGQGALRDVAHRLAAGLGEVAGEQL